MGNTIGTSGYGAFHPFADQCCWDNCKREPRADLPLCEHHARRIWARVQTEINERGRMQ